MSKVYNEETGQSLQIRTKELSKYPKSYAVPDHVARKGHVIDFDYSEILEHFKTNTGKAAGTFFKINNFLCFQISLFETLGFVYSVINVCTFSS